MTTRIPNAILALSFFFISQSVSADKTEMSIGETTPSSPLQTIQGKVVDLKDVVRGNTTALIFYRGGWCPYCNLHLSKLQTIESQLREMGIQIVAVSPDRPENLKASLDRHQLSYTLYSDSKLEAAKKFGLDFKVDEKTVTNYKKGDIDIEAASGQTHHMLPRPAFYLIDEEGVIRYSYSNEDYKVRIKVTEILKQARKLFSGKGQKGNKKSP